MRQNGLTFDVFSEAKERTHSYVLIAAHFLSLFRWRGSVHKPKKIRIYRSVRYMFLNIFLYRIFSHSGLVVNLRYSTYVYCAQNGRL